MLENKAISGEYAGHQSLIHPADIHEQLALPVTKRGDITVTFSSRQRTVCDLLA